MSLTVCCLMTLAVVCVTHSLVITDQLHKFKRSDQNVPGSCEPVSQQPQFRGNLNNFTVDLRMPGVVPPHSDSYLCMSSPVPTNQEVYIVDFTPYASMDTVHHMLLFGCQTPVSTSGYWDCGSSQGTCEDESSIMYAWARNAPPTKLPKDVGFKVGGHSKISYFVLQVHYGDVTAFKDHHKDCSGVSMSLTTKPQPFIAGIYLLMTVDTVIPPGNIVTNMDSACDYTSYPMYPFAFRTHTHSLGKVVSGYRVRDGKWTLIGRQSPQLPQAFYPVNKDVEVKYGDTLAARCVFTGEGRTSKTSIGSTSDDEMCNFYIMYYMDRKHAIPFFNCMKTGSKELFQEIPAEANVPINVPPNLMHSMTHKGHSDNQDIAPKDAAQSQDQDFHLEQVINWPQGPLQLGQVSGVAIDADSNLVVFHRGDHAWEDKSFDSKDRYQQKTLGPIQQSTILVLDTVSGKILKASGRNMFYLPHGITTDGNHYWVTDVALHQVFKVSSDGRDQILLSLGEAFVPGSDHHHFCKPTDVAVDSENGNIFISDGYCNARILKFSADGKYLSQWGGGYTDRRRRFPFRIPHSLVFLPDRREVCVADRENRRIQCFIAETGEFVKEIKKDEFSGEVFAITYSPVGDGLIYAVICDTRFGLAAPPKGFVINYSTKGVIDTFQPDHKGFKMPHDIAVTKDGTVFVGDVGTKAVYKFTSEKAHRSVKKAGIEVQELEEVEAYVQAKLKPEFKLKSEPKIERATVGPQKQIVPQIQKMVDEDAEKTKAEAKPNKDQSVFPIVMTTLLLVPLLLVVIMAGFICYRKRNQYEVKPEPTSVGGILGKLRGKAVGSLNLGNFFAAHKGYSRQGFDQLSTEGSDQERIDEDSSDSENEEYSALPPPRTS
ncbi:peptidyl-glycine alpha-amidating monooxygenase-like isoform X2 [Periophthalmus magnuspinnatus]|uniref:peptidyl-glycine alpha-amidating monooxygenase-like isoform X2 n=1 Tax=Periophthalmus magnuspinnatus TaxID=409849 RepID=UPI00145A4D1C|nr:peptidyl-glycine alpha-amidating monooxygenase-like isoform X2 [Periophthalmus magnuspinnatus]